MSSLLRAVKLQQGDAAAITRHKFCSAENYR